LRTIIFPSGLNIFEATITACRFDGLGHEGHVATTITELARVGHRFFFSARSELGLLETVESCVHPRVGKKVF
jgi:hypothetical protein